MAKLKKVHGPDAKAHKAPTKGWKGPDAPKVAKKKKVTKKKD